MITDSHENLNPSRTVEYDDGSEWEHEYHMTETEVRSPLPAPAIDRSSCIHSMLSEFLCDP